MPSLVTDILARARARPEQPVPADWYLTRLRRSASGMGAQEFEHEIPDAARELRGALDEGAHREALAVLVMMVWMVRYVVEQRAELELPPANGSIVRSLLGSTEELEWVHGDDESLPRTLTFLLDEALAAGTDRAVEEEDPRVAEYWRLSGRWLEGSVRPGQGERPRWPDDLDPAVPRPGLPLSFLCTAHAWALAGVLRGCSSLRRGRDVIDHDLLRPLCRSLDLLRRLDDEHDGYVAGEHDDDDLHEVIGALARTRRSLEQVAAAYLATLYGLERLDYVPPLWLEGEMPAMRPVPGGGRRTTAAPLVAAARAVTSSLVERDWAGAVRGLAGTCTVAANALRDEGGLPPHRRSAVADALRAVANDIAWGMNRIQEARGLPAHISTVTRFLRHVEGRDDNTYGSPIAWSGDAYRLMVEEHLTAIADALDPQMAGEVGFRPDRDQFGSVPAELSQGAALSRARALLRRYDTPLSPDGLGGDWGEDEGARILEALRELARVRVPLCASIDAMIARENEDMSRFTDGHVLWGADMVAVPRFEVAMMTEPPPVPTDPNVTRLRDGMGALHDVYPRFIDRALDIIEERGGEIRALGSSRAGELVLEVNGRVVTVHGNLDYYSCSCEDAHYRSREDRHLCKHAVAAAIILGDFTLREERHVRRAEGLSDTLAYIRERVLGERGEPVERLRRIALRQLAEREAPDRDRVNVLVERRLVLRTRIDALQHEHIETPLHRRERRRELRRELETMTLELTSVEEELSRTPDAPPRRPDIALERRLAEIRGRHHRHVDEEAIRLRQRRHELAAERERHSREMHELRAELGNLNDERDDEHRRHLVDRIAVHEHQLHRLEQESADLGRRLAELLDRTHSRVTIAQAPPGLWECAPPGEGG